MNCHKAALRSGLTITQVLAICRSGAIGKRRGSGWSINDADVARILEVELPTAAAADFLKVDQSRVRFLSRSNRFGRRTASGGRWSYPVRDLVRYLAEGPQKRGRKTDAERATRENVENASSN